VLIITTTVTGTRERLVISIPLDLLEAGCMLHLISYIRLTTSCSARVPFVIRGVPVPAKYQGNFVLYLDVFCSVRNLTRKKTNIEKGRCIVGFSPRRSRFDPKSFYTSLFRGKCIEADFSARTSICPSQYRSTNALYLHVTLTKNKMADTPDSFKNQRCFENLKSLGRKEP
jgi:hypothetical protein